MIPVSLYIKNFLSYGDNVPPLDFTEFNVACLSGKNGHGKSAVLDAMTWALWGEARKAAGEKSPSEGLLRIGTTDMQVELVFDLGGDRYRVLRKFQKKRQKRGTVTVEFQIFDETSDAYKALSEKTARGTQTKINNTLRMNYETFINSAFIIQGRVDEFTKKSPGKRKEILAEILDLSRYETLKELAKEHYRNAEKECALLEKQLESIQEELQHKAEYEQKLRELEQTLTQCDEKLTQQQAQRETLEKQRAELQGKRHQLEGKKQQQKHLREECERLDAQIARQKSQIAELDGILAQEKEILNAYKHYLELKAKETEYEEKRQQQSTYESQQRSLQDVIRDARHELEKSLGQSQTKRSQVQQTLNETQQVLEKEQEIDNGFHELQACREKDEQWEERRNRTEAIERSIKQIDEKIFQKKSQLEAQLHSLTRDIEKQRKLGDQATEREKQLQQCEEAIARLEALEKEREESKEHGTECRTQLENLKIRKGQLQKDRQDIQEKVDILKRSDQPQCPLCGSELNKQKKADIDDHFHQEMERLDTEEQQTNQAMQEQTGRLEELRKQYKQLEKQIASLKNARKDHVKAESALQESLKAQKHFKELNEQAEALQEQLQEKAYAQEEQKQVVELHKQKEELGYNAQEHQTLKQKLKILRRFEGEYSKLEDTRKRQRQAAEALPDIEAEIARITTALEQRTYVQAAHAQLQEVINRIQEIGYDEQAHVQVKQELQTLQDAPIRKKDLEQADKSIGSLRQTLADLVSQQQQKTGLLADFNRQIAELGTELEKLPALEQELREVNRILQRLQKDRDNVLQDRGTYQNKHEHCKQLETKAAQQKREKKQAEKDRDMYERLTKIFGKDGIQAYLIDNAIPEIEHEANAILSRLTDNRAYIAIESLKDSKSGGTKETLDIKISDELGTRSYEMYSGGESFRVDFAIRIALSKLLANRAGTQLKALVIDEGFGTQDARGLEQLVEAIKAISMDFEKILVITHLEALKDAFPVRIEVVKHPDIGSQYQIVH